MLKDLLEQILLPEFSIEDNLYDVTGFYQIYYWFHEHADSKVWVGNAGITESTIRITAPVINGVSIDEIFEVANPDFSPDKVKEILMKTINSVFKAADG